MELMNQPFTGQLGDRLIKLLDSKEYDTLNIIVAFAKNSGVLRIKDSLNRFMDRGGTVNIYVGVDLGVTSYEALTTLFLCNASLNIVHTEKGQTFHAKIYQFLGKEKGIIVVGSHNLTAGGLWTNFESSIIAPIDKSSAIYTQMLKGMDDYINNLKSLEDSFRQIKSQTDIDSLLNDGYVFKEVAEQVKRANNLSQNLSKEHLFGNGVAANLPYINTSRTETTEIASDIKEKLFLPSSDEKDETIWFETREMTGGSRNILDLSKKSLIKHGNPKGTSFEYDDPKFMRGGVEFFGLNPNSTDQKKSITINFEGLDYVGNTILFPKGKKSNGTWRLQINGVNDSQNITEVLKNKYLVKKIITFTKVKDDYYFMSVFPESDLEDFKKASRILAYNGSTQNARSLGLL